MSRSREALNDFLSVDEQLLTFSQKTERDKPSIFSLISLAEKDRLQQFTIFYQR